VDEDDDNDEDECSDSSIDKKPIDDTFWQAVRERHCLVIVYSDMSDVRTQRRVDVYFSKYDRIFCYCHLKKAAREFKLSSIVSWFPTDHTFEWDENVANSIRLNALPHKKYIISTT
jgi:predicted DNA-binding transcriptional regulator YafY